MWIILIIFLLFFSFYLLKKTNKDYLRLNIVDLIKNDKSGFFLSLATKIGVGSIIGTISSVILGGYSSIIWLIFFSIISIPFIIYEAKYGSIYKKRLNNKYISGPYFIIKYGLNNRILSIIALIIFILLYSFLFQMIQINTISELLRNTLFINKKYIVIFLFIILFITINLSIDETKKILSIIVPFKCLLFIIVCLFGIISHYKELLLFLKSINIINYKSIFSGFIVGIKRSIFMNEILIGTTSTSSGSDNNDVKISVKYQILSMLFISLVITILVSFVLMIYDYKYNIICDYNLLITKMFMHTNSYIGLYLIVIILILFAFTTLLSGYYILKSNIEYIFKKKYYLYIFNVIFLIICLLGIMISHSKLWLMSDILIFIMIIINTYSIIKLMRK